MAAAGSARAPGGASQNCHEELATLGKAAGPRRRRRDPNRTSVAVHQDKPAAVPRARSSTGWSGTDLRPAIAAAGTSEQPGCSWSRHDPFVLQPSPASRLGPCRPAGRPACRPSDESLAGPPFLLAWEMSTPVRQGHARGCSMISWRRFPLRRNGFRPVDRSVYNPPNGVEKAPLICAHPVHICPEPVDHHRVLSPRRRPSYRPSRVLWRRSNRWTAGCGCSDTIGR